MKETIVLAFLFSLVIHHLTNFKNGNKEKITFNTSSISDTPYKDQVNLYNSNINKDIEHESLLKSNYLPNSEDRLSENQVIYYDMDSDKLDNRKIKEI